MLLIQALKRYFNDYSGLPHTAWKGIFLSLSESKMLGTYYFLAIYFVDELGFNVATAGMLISTYGLGTVFGGLVGGRLSDKYNVYWVLILSLIFQALAILLLTYLKNFTTIAFDLFILGVGTYCFITANNVLVLKNCRASDQLKALNILNVASNLGIGLASVLIVEIVRYSFKTIFCLSSIGLFILAGILFFNKLCNTHTISNEYSPIENCEANNKTPKPPSLSIYLVLICLFFIGMIVAQLGTTYPLFLRETFPQLGLRAFSILFAINIMLIILFQNNLVNRFAAYNKLLVIGVAAFLTGLGMFALNFSYNFYLAIVSCLLYSAGEMIFFSIVQLYCYQYGDSNKKGSMLGLYRSVYATSRLAGPTLAAYIYYHFGPNVLWSICGLIGAFFLLMFKFYNMEQLTFSINSNTSS